MAGGVGHASWLVEVEERVDVVAGMLGCWDARRASPSVSVRGVTDASIPSVPHHGSLTGSWAGAFREA